jgi:hypothetical protein
MTRQCVPATAPQVYKKGAKECYKAHADTIGARRDFQMGGVGDGGIEQHVQVVVRVKMEIHFRAAC